MTQAVRWVSSSLEEVADDKEADDDDSIPLVPLSEEAETAMENAQFLKLLTALGLLPPSREQVQFRSRIIPWSEFVVHESYMLKIM